MNDPVKHCPVYKQHGCAHVDGYLCDFPNCSIIDSMTNQTSEWDPILTPAMTEYGWVRVNEHTLEIEMAHWPTGWTMHMDKRAIPQLIKILQRLDKQV